ncbi:MAG: hypothetical protein QNL94_12990 [Halioglobus sp.]|jgi:hypothetical protein|tara:strand:+ start:1879 stop:2103 length:225 start_codon:yes stop_codon:yes gene_type:complete
MLGIEPYGLVYENFVANPKQCTRDIAAAMDIKQMKFDESCLTMRSHCDHTNVRFKKRFLEDYNSEQSSGIHPAP